MSLRLAFIIAAAAAAFSSQALSQDLKTAALPADPAQAFAPVLQTSLQPMGWRGFCKKYPGECDSRISGYAEVRLTRSNWRDLVAVNLAFNKAIEPVTDEQQWGVAESWDFPDTNRGDCEDYVLAKRRALIAKGFPRQALLITVVRDNLGEGHAVLTVVTDKGDLILDNRRNDVLSWTQTGYSYIKRQSHMDQNIWVSLGAPQTTTTATTASR